MKQLKKLLFGLLILASIALIGMLILIAYVDIHSSEAKDYLMEKYEFKKKDLFAIKYVEYAYEDITDCSSLWFKKCTSNENLLYEYTFKTKDGDKIIVTEDVNGTFNDNHKKDATINDNIEEPTIEVDKPDEDPISTPDVPVAEA